MEPLLIPQTFLLISIKYNNEETLLRNKLLLLSIVSFILLCFPLVPLTKAASMWSRTYGGTEQNLAYSLVEASDGGYAIAGNSLLVKIDALGNMQWNKTYSGVAYSIVATSDGGYALAGAVAGDFWLMKIDSDGDVEWNQTYGGTGDDYAFSLVVTSDGGYALAGSTASFGAGGVDFWLVKTDSLGDMEWNVTYGGSGDEWACSVIATPDGGYALAGVCNCSMSYWIWYGFFYDGDCWLVKTDAFGNMEWSQTYGGAGSDWASSVVATSDGGYAIAGTWNFTMSIDTGGGDFWLIKTDSNGDVEWNQKYGGEGEDLAYSLVATSDGGYAIAGTWYFRGPLMMGSADFWLVKTDLLGDMQWNYTYGDTGDDIARSLITTSDGGYAIAGTWDYIDFSGDTAYGWETFLEGDYGLVKTDENGIVPEYSSLLIPTLVLTTTAFIIINKKRLLHKRSEKP
jgi:hypothetical protein